MSLLLGIDPSVTCSGYALIDAQDNIKDIGTIVTSKDDSETVRLDKIYWEIKSMCETYKPDEAIIEDQYVGPNPQVSLFLARARGVAMLACHHAGVKVILYSPMEIKKAMTGKGNAKKEIVQLAAVEKYKHNGVIQELFGDGIKKSGKKKNDDISDALAAVHTHKTLQSGRSA